jgi:hypothetical protein
MEDQTPKLHEAQVVERGDQTFAGEPGTTLGVSPASAPQEVQDHEPAEEDDRDQDHEPYDAE